MAMSSFSREEKLNDLNPLQVDRGGPAVKCLLNDLQTARAAFILPAANSVNIEYDSLYIVASSQYDGRGYL